KTKSNLSENSIYFLLWGWVTFIAIIGQFFLKVVFNYEHHYLVWLLTIPAAIVSIIYSSRRHNKHKVRTYIGESMSYLWTGIGISIFLLCMIISKTNGGWNNAWPFFILMYGLGTFVSGMILKFKPLILGGIICWILTLISVFVPFDYQLLLAAGAILSSYIIPGHLLSGVNK
ncbi:MAG TPA: hypothetical protein VJ499_10115, partial [Flavisolibacter sp.]|nr:hypothetical protein [Flavisolibacter sp.]